ncbi:Nucleotide-binding universal stress protein, UspA family [Kushneria avicenniae]|uniref:Nucleotide-binding universal stress protein, UspA family n=1 Tax=Kushneria avicenniae TaxID=402385 RepID=A0A1I1LDL8_9GAMM|nr:universal stress protein [Kushneria avicenniae]SFC71174.1 Nucleotide-binding universal stress protein, UspA family [Kushneria avicenniae]
MFTSLLVPVDGSAHARKAMSIAAQLASPDATLHLLYVRELLPHLHYGSLLSLQEAVAASSPENAETEIRTVLEQSQAHLRQRFDGCIETHGRHGDPARVIAHEADTLGAQVIVIGSRGLSDWNGMIMGSVSHKVSHIASCMVISVHDDEDTALPDEVDDNPYQGL